MDKLRRALSGQNDEEQGGIIDEATQTNGDTIFGSLSWETRIKGFLLCFLLGAMFSLLASIAMFFWKYALFGLLFTIGNLLSLTSTCFLMGPIRQFKKMFAKTRAIATVVMIVFFVLTLMAALWWHKPPLVLIFCIFQYLAMTWYSISYIPYARDAVINIFKSCI